MGALPVKLVMGEELLTSRHGKRETILGRGNRTGETGVVRAGWVVGLVEVEDQPAGFDEGNVQIPPAPIGLGSIGRVFEGNEKINLQIVAGKNL